MNKEQIKHRLISQYGREAERYYRDAIQRVLDGKYLHITDIFTWSDTPQGSNFWSNLYSDLGHGRKNDNLEEALSFLRWLIKDEVVDNGET